MGQQQLLLIVIGVILVGIAIVLGIQYFSVSTEKNIKDEITAHCITVGANAQQWFKKPADMGGGGNSFVGFGSHFTDNLTGLHSSTNGKYTVPTIADTQITVQGDPDPALGYTWYVETTVTVNTISTTIVQN